MSRPIPFASVMRAAALATAVALLPATTAGLPQVEGRASPEFARLFATYQRIKASYVEPVEDEVLIRGAIDGMLAALDPHSAYLDGASLEAARNHDRRQLSGPRHLDPDGGRRGQGGLAVPGSPADNAGIKAGDFITHINGRADLWPRHQ